MTLSAESEVVITRKNNTQIELSDSRGRPYVSIKIPDVYGMRKESSPVTATLTSPVANTTYYVYATEPDLPWGMPRSTTGFDVVMSTNSGLTSKHKLLGTILTNDAGNIMDIVQAEDETEVMLEAAIPVDLGGYFKSEDTIQLSMIPATATKAIISVSVRSPEKDYATARFYVPGQSKPIDFVQSGVGETTEEKTFKMPVPDANNSVQYKVEHTRGSLPGFHIHVLGWME